jgi:hypothetical protein
MRGTLFQLLTGRSRPPTTAQGAEALGPVAASHALEEEEDPGGAAPANGLQAESFWASAGGKWWAAPRVLGQIAYGLQK